jgi:hypothetical protein
MKRRKEREVKGRIDANVNKDTSISSFLSETRPLCLFLLCSKQDETSCRRTRILCFLKTSNSRFFYYQIKSTCPEGIYLLTIILMGDVLMNFELISTKNHIANIAENFGTFLRFFLGYLVLKIQKYSVTSKIL